MKCPRCGADMKEGQMYCEHCGREIQIVPEFDPALETSRAKRCAGKAAFDEKPQKRTLEGVCRPFCRSSSLRGHEPDFLASYPGISV